MQKFKKYLLSFCAGLTLSISSITHAVTVDLLVLYDQYSNNYYGGDVRTAMNSWVATINDAYRNSKVDIQLRLVGVNSFYITATDMHDALNRVSSDQTANAIRNSLGADFVTFLYKRDPDICGRGFAAVDANKAWNVVGPDCDALSMAHELGHNMGLNHSRRQGNGSGVLYGYGLGYGVDYVFVDIMAYWSAFNTTNIRPVFSNPTITCQGLPCGVPVGNPNEAYAALALENVKNTVANFKPTTTPVPPRPTAKFAEIVNNQSITSGCTLRSVGGGYGFIGYEMKCTDVTFSIFKNTSNGTCRLSTDSPNYFAGSPSDSTCSNYNVYKYL